MPTIPFRFRTRLPLSELTGLKAKNLKELLESIKTVPGSVIYYHTHHFLQQHPYLSQEPSNDFAYWVTQSLNGKELGERLGTINPYEFTSIRALREKIVSVLEDGIGRGKRSMVEAPEGEEFYFRKTVSFVFDTPHVVSSLEEFLAVLPKVTIHSIYFHMCEARLRLEEAAGDNDFSVWMERDLGDKILAKRIAALDPYSHTMEGLRTKIIRLTEGRLKEMANATPERV